MTKLLGRDIVVYLAEKGELNTPGVFPAGEDPVDEECVSESEKAAALWVLKNNKHAGATTDTLSGRQMPVSGDTGQQPGLRRRRHRYR